MIYHSKYSSPLGDILIICDEKNLTGLYFYSSRYFPLNLQEINNEKVSLNNKNHVLNQTKLWLDEYFSGKQPEFTPPYSVSGTDFQKMVWQIISQIPYGKTLTYGEIARLVSDLNSSKKISAQAVGNAVGKNKISLIIPCHRVIGAKGDMKGYAGGIDKKIKLLSLEKENSTGNR